MKKPIIFRKRFIPNEVVDISEDELLYRTDKMLITRWKPIRPRSDFSGGTSYTFLEEGIKISRFNQMEGGLKYWYVDIIEVEYKQEIDQYTLTDLLVDVLVMPDGKVTVLDLDELAELMLGQVVSIQQSASAVQKLHVVLKMIDEGAFPPEICKREEYW